MLGLTGHANFHVAGMAMEFWDAFREVPLEKRHPVLGQVKRA
jgi:hypothetical protein